MSASKLRKTGRFQRPQPAGAVELRPTNLSELRHCLDPAAATPLPIRPRGSGSAVTDCNSSIAGTTLHTTGLDRLVNVDAHNGSVTVQAGVRLNVLVDTLAEYGLELVGGYELQGRTVGGAIAAPCFGPSIGRGGGYFSTHVSSLKIVLADGRLLRIRPDQGHLLSAFRMSFGLLGVIYEATLRVRPIRTFSASHRRVDIGKFAAIVDTLSNSDIGFKFYLMPYRNRVYLDLRRYESAPGNAYRAPWKLKDWGESTVLPHVFRSLNRVLPVRKMKYNLIDTISEATQNIVNSRFVNSGNNAAALSGYAGDRKRGRVYSTWCFPAANFSLIAKAYRDFCVATYDECGYRCDLPAVGYRLCRDSSSPLSPSHDEPMIALTTTSTQTRGWEDFVIDLAEFAEKWGGMPLLSQSRALRAENAIQSYARRLDLFRRMRRQLDPDNRLLSPFMAQFCQ
jgi:FAD/FMN-containing dehydrogenase